MKSRILIGLSFVIVFVASAIFSTWVTVGAVALAMLAVYAEVMRWSEDGAKNFPAGPDQFWRRIGGIIVGLGQVFFSTALQAAFFGGGVCLALLSRNDLWLAATVIAIGYLAELITAIAKHIRPDHPHQAKLYGAFGGGLLAWVGYQIGLIPSLLWVVLIFLVLLAAKLSVPFLRQAILCTNEKPELEFGWFGCFGPMFAIALLIYFLTS